MISTQDTGQAFIRDNALVLYFNNAETPFVARFDLDSLAQATFEVADKKEGLFALTLRDFSGQAQTIGQFAAKSDAHQALYAILQALLSHKEQMTGGCQRKSFREYGFRRLIKGILRWMLFIVGTLALLWIILGLIPAPHQAAAPAPKAVSSNASRVAAPVTTPPTVAKAAAPGLSTLPEGEAVDADSVLATPAPTAAQQPAAQ